MTDDELRTLVREAIARHLGGRAGSGGEAAGTAGPRPHASSQRQPDPAWRAHPSFGRFLDLHTDDAGACLIEPAVQCTHCGFCQSMGH